MNDDHLTRSGVLSRDIGDTCVASSATGEILSSHRIEPDKGYRLRPLRGRHRRPHPAGVRRPRARRERPERQPGAARCRGLVRRPRRPDRAVLTDNAWAYTKATYPATVDAIGARHRRTRPHWPQTNGKAERFIKTLLHEWAYGRLYPTNAERLERLQPWVHLHAQGTKPGLGCVAKRSGLRPKLGGRRLTRAYGIQCAAFDS
jgi:hypothetical protein